MSKSEKVVISYPSHNRLEYVAITLPQLIEETRNTKHLTFLYAGDDASTDGTREYLESVDGIDLLQYAEVGNSIWQLNRAFEIAREIGAPYVLACANDILHPDGFIDAMVKLMQDYPDACSIMVEEGQNLPYIKPVLSVEENTFTSSLGIHRTAAFPQEMVANNRFFGFDQYQRKAIKNDGYACYRVKGIANTNLDCSPWSRQMEYHKKGYARTGLVGNEKAIYTEEIKANEESAK